MFAHYRIWISIGSSCLLNYLLFWVFLCPRGKTKSGNHRISVTKRKTIDLETKITKTKKKEGGKTASATASHLYLTRSTISNIWKTEEKKLEAASGWAPVRGTAVTDRRQAAGVSALVQGISDQRQRRPTSRSFGAKPLRKMGKYTHTHTHTHIYIYIYIYHCSTVVKVLYYKSEGRWFDSRWCHWNFSLT